MTDQYDISLNNTQHKLPVNEQRLREVARRTLAEEQVAEARISIAVVDDETMRRLNRQYLAHDYATDVLSFLLESEAPSGSDPGRSEPPRGNGKRLEGEVILSVETAERAAVEFRWTSDDEIVLYLVHGLLHLMGYEDETTQERSLMRARETAILSLWNLKPYYADADGANGDAERSQPPDCVSGADS